MKLVSEQKRRDIQDAIEDGIRLEDIRTLLSTSSATITSVKREMGIAIRPRQKARKAAPAPTAAANPYSPQEYFEAIANGLRERDSENALLRHQVADLQTETRRILADLNQCKHQMANWSGPASLPNRSLGNGG
jgi:hypothetical protein